MCGYTHLQTNLADLRKELEIVSLAPTQYFSSMPTKSPKGARSPMEDLYVIYDHTKMRLKGLDSLLVEILLIIHKLSAQRQRISQQLSFSSTVFYQHPRQNTCAWMSKISISTLQCHGMNT